MKTLFGSRAIKFWFNDFREPNDYDYITDEKLKSGNGIEYHPNYGVFDEIMKFGPIVPPEVSLTLKMSHAFWDVHWEKTMSDILFLQKKNITYLPNLFDKLKKHWKFYLGNKKVNLNKNNEDFFSDKVSRVIDHDKLHEIVAYGNEPLYKKIKEDQSKAKVEYHLFLSLSEKDKLNLCREEIYVIALERFLIPSRMIIPIQTAYLKAVKQLVTTMTDGFFPEFIILNWKSLYTPSDFEWIKKCKSQKII